MFKVDNKTRRFLLPSLIKTPRSFRKAMQNYKFVACGLWDEEEKDRYDDNCLAYLINAKESVLNFNFDVVKDHYYYGEKISGHLHMLVLRIPDEYSNAKSSFIESKYSQMYKNPSEVFKPSGDTKRRNIINTCLSICGMDPIYKTNLEKSLGINFETLENDGNTIELAEKINLSEEVFTKNDIEWLEQVS